MKKQKRHSITLSILLFIIATSFTNDKGKYPPLSSFPQPEGIDNLLFYIQRAKDINTIVYQLNTDKKGNLIEDHPINAYWIRYAENKQIVPLTIIQEKFAYGLKVKSIDERNKIYQFNFVSYKNRFFYLKQSLADGKFHVYGRVNNQLAEINKLFINIQGGSFWFPKIDYVAINGRSIKSNNPLVELVIP